jgi:hypothetical protein
MAITLQESEVLPSYFDGTEETQGNPEEEITTDSDGDGNGDDDE